MAPIELVNSLNNRVPVLHKVFNYDESNAKYDKGYCYYEIVIKVLIEPVVKKDANYSCRNACKSYLKPQNDLILHYISSDSGILKRMFVILESERPYIFPEDNNDRQDRTKLDNNEIKIVEFR